MKSDSLLRSTGLFSLATFISRILGLVREASIAAFIPLIWQDIFWAGFKIPNTFRNLFAEGSLSAAFIPLLARVREQEGEEAAREVGYAVFWFMVTIIGVIVVILTALAPLYVPYILEFSGQEESEVLAIYHEDQLVNSAVAGQKVEIVVEKTPFFAEADSPVGDRGTITDLVGNTLIQVENTRKTEANVKVHESVIELGVIRVGDTVRLTVPNPIMIERSVTVTQLMYPFLYFIALAAWAMGVLNSYRYFFIPALASAFSNVSIILGALLGPMFFSDMPLMWFMAVAVIIGGIMQFGVQLFQTHEVGYFPPRRVTPFHPRVKELLRMLAPSVFGLAVYQINALITQTYFASKFEAGVSTTTYAFRLIQFPLGIIGVALATASFPRIAQFIAQNKHDLAAKTFSDVMKYLMLLMIPAAVGLIVLGKDIIGMIFDHGEFKQGNLLDMTYWILVFYSLGLLSYSLVTIFARTSQAHHDFKSPVISGTIGVVLNIFLCTVFVRSGLDIWSLALAAAIASTANALSLFYILRHKLTRIPLLEILGFGARVCAATLGMGILCYALLALLPPPDHRFHLYILRVALGLPLSMAVFFGLGWLLFRPEMRTLLKLK